MELLRNAYVRILHDIHNYTKEWLKVSCMFSRQISMPIILPFYAFCINY